MAQSRTNGPIYWCHTCQGEVQVNETESHEKECATCRNSFVEEVDGEEDHPSDFVQTTPNSETEQTQEGNTRSLTEFVVQQILNSHVNTRDPMAFLVQSNSAGPGAGFFSFGSEIASSPGDYHFGSASTFNALINQLMQADQRRGPPPASKAFVEAIPKVAITAEKAQFCTDCAVCKDIFKIGEECSELPCKHLFCHDCIRPWLKEHNTCPVCRHELPTDDQDYERERKARVNSQGNQEQAVDTTSSSGEGL